MAETATDAIYRALRSPEPDPDLVHAAVEEIRGLSGQNVIATIGAKIDSQSAGSMLNFLRSRPRSPSCGPRTARFEPR